MNIESSPNRYFKIRGMDCAEEVAVLKSEIGPVVGGRVAGAKGYSPCPSRRQWDVNLQATGAREYA